MDGYNKMSRYARQIAVAGFGLQGQQLLANAKILVVGAGGLASPVLQYLVAAGIGHIVLVDPDIVSLSNLHRQTIYRDGDLGVAKVEAATKHMYALNPDSEITPIQQSIGPDNLAIHTADVDLVLDCADSFAVSYSLSDFCLGRLPLVHASVTGMAGYCGGFCGAAPSLRAVFPDLPQRFGSCAEDGVLGPVVGVIGALQAQMALAIITQQVPSPLGQLVTYDATGNRFGGFRFDQAHEPELRLGFMSQSEIADDDFVIDLREVEEAALITEEASRLRLEQISSDLPLEGKSRVVLCCRSGQRAWAAGEKVAAFWPGPISLIAVGDPNLVTKEI